MKVSVWGAAGDVTGSAYLVETDRSRVLVDFGLFQGGRDLEAKNRLPKQIRPRELDAVLVTHGHLDHTGRLPLLTKAGFSGPIFATPATVQMTELILRDAAHIQESDAERTNRKRERAGKAPITPLFTASDVERLLARFQPAIYGEAFSVAPGIAARLVDSGHMLGSVSIQLTVQEDGREKRVVFSGDLGPADMPWLRDAVPFQQADLLFLESTYGDRDHRSLAATLQEAQAIIVEAVARKSKILIPAFAIGRSQQMLYHIAALIRDQVVPPFPIYLDSPMAIEATQIYTQHPELFDTEAAALLRSGQLQADLSNVRIAETAEQSKQINEAEGPCAVVASSGMCEAGRILHHLRHNLWRPQTTVLIVGFQAAGSLGRQLVDGAPTVRIFGEEIAVKAQIHTLGGFSAHAGQTGLLQWFDAMATTRPRVVLTHGEADKRNALADQIARRYGVTCDLPLLGDSFSL